MVFSCLLLYEAAFIAPLEVSHGRISIPLNRKKFTHLMVLRNLKGFLCILFTGQIGPEEYNVGRLDF